jgi:hypothetical protein
LPGDRAEQQGAREGGRPAALSSNDRKPMRSLPDVMRIHAAALLLGALVLAGCSHPEPDRGEGARPSASNAGAAETATGSRESAELTVVDGELEQTTWVLQDQVYGLPGTQAPERLGGAVNAPFVGTLSPAAVPHPANDRLLAYNSFLEERPVLRVHDLEKGEDFVVDEGAYSLAWRRDGALAYFKGLTPSVQNPARDRGHVIVRASVESEPVRWTAEPGRYAVSAWVGERLIAHELGQEWPNLVVFDGPKRTRTLAKRAALVALSSDGEQAFITREPAPSPTVSAVDIANGDEVATFTFSDEVDPIRGQPINYVVDSGTWTGDDTVIASVTRGLAVFRVANDKIALEELLGVDPEAFPLGLTEPKSDESGRYVAASAELMQKPGAATSRTAIMECDRVERRCVLGRSGPSFLPPRLVYNPSRP